MMDKPQNDLIIADQFYCIVKRHRVGDADISAIGAIIDQHDLAPSTVITSGIQDASQLVYLVGEFYREQNLQPIIYRFGLKNQVIELAPSRGNIEPATETRINRIKSELAENEVNVDY